MKKGFVHIVEIVMITLLVFLLIGQFTSIPRIDNDWTRAKLYLQANDLAFTLEKKGVTWRNATQVSQELSGLLNPNTVYAVSITNSSGTFEVIANQINNPVTATIVTVNRQPAFRIEQVTLSLGTLF